ncbi:hypothetical protein K501DRAFT_270774, partial [Backusella circina FSU 941]
MSDRIKRLYQDMFVGSIVNALLVVFCILKVDVGQKPSQQIKPVCMMFIVSLLPKYKELVSDGLKKAYKDKNDKMDLDDSKVDSTEHVPLFFSELQDFCVTASREIELAVQEFKKLETSKKRVFSEGEKNHGQSNKAFKSNSKASPRNSSSPSTPTVPKSAKSWN